MKKVKKIRKIKKIKKIKRIKTFVPRTKEDITVSKVEKQFGCFLTKFGIELDSQFRIAYKFYDFKVKDKNILLELDGDFYHYNPKTQGGKPANSMQRKNMKNDKIKNALAVVNGYKLLRFWEDDFKNNKHMIIEKLKNEGLIL